MNDSVFQTGKQAGQYQTYKLALYIYASKVLGYPVNQSAEEDMLRMQNTTSGGFYTGYDSNFSNNGTNTNVETTSLAILALLPAPPRIPEFPTLIAVAIVLIVAAAGILFFKKQRLSNSHY